jgi:hypothetical protein
MPDETPTPSSTPAAPAAATVAATPPPSPSSTDKPAAPSDKPAAPATVTISTETYQTFVALQTEHMKLQQEQRQREDEARKEKLDLMVKEGKAQEAIRETRDDADRRVKTEQELRMQIESRAKKYAIDSELIRALSDQKLNPGAGEQLTDLFRKHFNAEPQGESFAVRTVGGQSPAEFVAAQLAQPNFAHFKPATGAGGAGGSAGGQFSGPTPPAIVAAGKEPATLGEAIIAQFAARKAADTTDARLDMSSGMGLRRTAAR